MPHICHVDEVTQKQCFYSLNVTLQRVKVRPARDVMLRAEEAVGPSIDGYGNFATHSLSRHRHGVMGIDKYKEPRGLCIYFS